MADLSVMGFLNEETQQETEYNLKDAQARSDISAINGKIPSEASSSNKLATASDISNITSKIPSNASSNNKLVTQSDVSSAYHHAGTKTVAELTSSLLVAANEGNVYNMTDAGTTTADFIDGAGKPIKVGDNVGIAKVGSAYKFDLLSGFVDTSGFYDTSDALETELDGADKFPVFDFSASAKRNITFGSIKVKLKEYFDLFYTNLVSSPTAGNFAGLDANGDLVDSGKKASDFATVSDVNAKISWSEADKYVGKNLLFPINSADVSSGNITIKNNHDGTYTVNGSVSSQLEFVVLSRYPSGNNNHPLYLPIGEYIYTTGDSRIKVAVGTTYNGAYSAILQSSAQTGGRFSITAKTNSDYKLADGSVLCALYLYIPTGVTFSNAKLSLMIRKSSITDDDYVPYIPDNTKLMTLEANSFLGVKNLISPTETKGGSKNNVSWVVNNNGSVTVNSSGASADCWIRLQDYVPLPNGTYIINGCPAGGAEGKYHLSFYVRKADDSGDEVGYKDYGEGAKFILNYSSMRRMQVSIFVKNGQSIDNLTFYPMVRVAEDVDDTYCKHSETNQELTDGKIPWYTNESAGVKNLLPNAPKSDSTGGDDPVTFTVDSNGVVSISAGRVPANGTNFELGRLLCKAKVGYRLTGMPNLNTADIKLRVGKLSSESDSGVGTLDDNASYDGGYSVGRTGYIFYNTDQWINISVNIAGGTSGTIISEALTFYPMVRYEDDADDTYVSHAMTNEQLTKLGLVYRGAIPSGADLDNYVEFGVYDINGTAPTNFPSGSSGYVPMLVFPRWGHGNIKQIIISRNNEIYLRNKNDGESWSSWYKFAGTVVS